MSSTSVGARARSGARARAIPDAHSQLVVALGGQVLNEPLDERLPELVGAARRKGVAQLVACASVQSEKLKPWCHRVRFLL